MLYPQNLNCNFCLENRVYFIVMNGSKRTLFIIIGCIFFYAVFTLVSYQIFSKAGSTTQKKSTVTEPIVKSKFPTPDPSLPKTEVCPLNGLSYTKPEKEIWSQRRPLAVMIENSKESRPQSGLSFADVVYEAIAEGGITRFMGIFHCGSAYAGNLTIAPVRSARIYYVNLLPEYDPLYVHVGGAGNCDDPNVDPRAKALCAIQRNKVKDLDQMGRAGDFKTCHRLTNRLDHEVAWEHTMACFVEELHKAGKKWGWTNVDKQGVSWDKYFIPWKFTAEPNLADTQSALNISYPFWDINKEFQSDYDVAWQYDSASGNYLRSNGGVKSIDLETGEPMSYKTVIVQLVKETHLNDLEKHLLYDVIGSGKGYVFTQGKAIAVTWSKNTRTSRTTFINSKTGKEIQFIPGKIWISLVPSTNTITFN